MWRYFTESMSFTFSTESIGHRSDVCIGLLSDADMYTVKPVNQDTQK